MPNVFCLQNKLVESILIKKKIISSSDTIVRKKEKLTISKLSKLNPKYIFLPHWSHFVPYEIFTQHECIAFHAAPLPYGRGGSPIQNMIKLGHKKTKVCAFRVNAKMDSGPIYCHSNLSLLGSGEEIYEKLYVTIGKMIKKILTTNIKPKKQKNKRIKNFKRLTYKDNKIPKDKKINEIYDHIRMTDVLDYPRAYLEYGNLKLSFEKPLLKKNMITANVKISFKTNAKNKKRPN